MSRPFPGMMPNFNRPQPGPEPPCQGEEKREDRVEVVSESEPVQDVEKTEQAEKPEKITWQSDGETSLGSVLKKCNCSLDEWFAVNDPDRHDTERKCGLQYTKQGLTKNIRTSIILNIYASLAASGNRCRWFWMNI